MFNRHAKEIYTTAISKCLPTSAVQSALKEFCLPKGKLVAVAIGKAAWQMASTASEILGDSIDRGIVITKYGHSKGAIHGFEIMEAGHPVPDSNSLLATKKALEITDGLCKDDAVLFLVSGGGSALFESIDCSLEELQGLTKSLLASGASINQVNAVRKHLSNVKGGRFAQHVSPASVFVIALSDVLGNDPDAIASGPACADPTTVEQVNGILSEYGITPSPEVYKLLQRETPKTVTNSRHVISGSVSELCRFARESAQALGYNAQIVTYLLSCQARTAGQILASVAKTHKDTSEPMAFIFGGETVVHLRGNGMGGRNQELALSAATEIEGMSNACVFAVGSDGTDGPTDAAGGFADGKTASELRKLGIDPVAMLDNNDSYNALKDVNGLIFTGPTGTNVNDLYVVLIRPKEV